jgi:hypothetical protein
VLAMKGEVRLVREKSKTCLKVIVFIDSICETALLHPRIQSPSYPTASIIPKSRSVKRHVTPKCEVSKCTSLIATMRDSDNAGGEHIQNPKVGGEPS